jgi:transketolase
VEHLASLRAMPNLHVFRPADVVETAECWDAALKSGETPSVLSLTRQGLPQLRLEKSDENLSARGGYILREAKGGTPRAILIATGSEVSLAIEAQERLEAKNIPTRVVSMPCTSLFDAQPEAYRAAVLGDELPDVIRLAVEAASTYGWERYVGRDGVIIGMTGFGASAPASDLFTYFGITTEAVVEAITSRL